MRAALALLLLSASPALASSDAIWNCGKTIKATAGKGGFTIEMGEPYKGGYPPRASISWDFRGDKREIRLDGKVCKEIN